MLNLTIDVDIALADAGVVWDLVAGDEEKNMERKRVTLYRCLTESPLLKKEEMPKFSRGFLSKTRTPDQCLGVHQQQAQLRELLALNFGAGKVDIWSSLTLFVYRLVRTIRLKCHLLVALLASRRLHTADLSSSTKSFSAPQAESATGGTATSSPRTSSWFFPRFTRHPRW